MIHDPALEEIQLDLLRARAAFQAAVNAVPESLRDTRPAPDRWSVAEIVEHVAIVNTRVAMMLTALAPTAPQLAAAAMASATEFDFTAMRDRSTRLMAPEMVHPQSRMDSRAAWILLTQSWDAVDAAMVASSGRDLTTVTRPHPALGSLDGYQWFWSLGGHEDRHRDQIVELAEALTAN